MSQTLENQQVALLQENARLRRECMRLKKAISYCRRRQNRGLPVEEVRMRKEVEAEMKHYRAEEAEPPTDIVQLTEENEDFARYLAGLLGTLEAMLGDAAKGYP